jgi:hypothetical protein
MYDTHDCNSSVVKSYEYNNYANVLLIKFMDNSIYQYSFLPVSVYNRFLMSESKGRFIHKNMKAYPYIKIAARSNV